MRCVWWVFFFLIKRWDSLFDSLFRQKWRESEEKEKYGKAIFHRTIISDFFLSTSTQFHFIFNRALFAPTDYAALTLVLPSSFLFFLWLLFWQKTLTHVLRRGWELVGQGHLHGEATSQPQADVRPSEFCTQELERLFWQLGDTRPFPPLPRHTGHATHSMAFSSSHGLLWSFPKRILTASFTYYPSPCIIHITQLLTTLEIQMFKNHRIV